MRPTLLLTMLLTLSCGNDSAPHRAAVTAPTTPSLVAQWSRAEVAARDGALLSVRSLRANPQRGRASVLLVHQLNATSAEWDDLASVLATEFDVFTVDLRGHGRSTLTSTGQGLAWRDFAESEWQKLPTDALDVLDWLMRDPAKAPTSIVLVGSSIGGSAVLLAASQMSAGPLRGVALLSPGRAYRGLDAVGAANELAVPLYVAVSDGEAPSVESATDLDRIVRSHGVSSRLTIVTGTDHGTRMLLVHPELKEAMREQLRAWLR